MRIAFLTNGIHPWVIGGMQKHSYFLVKYLARQGVDLVLWHPALDDGREPEGIPGFTDAEMERVDLRWVPWPREGILPGHYVRASYEFSERIWNELALESNAFDLIYAKGFTAWCSLLEKQKGADLPPIAVKLHGYEMFQPAFSLKEWIGHRILRRAARENTLLADHVFSYGGRITELIKNLRVPEERILELPAAIPEEALVSEVPKREEDEPVRFVFLGRYERRKGIEDLMALLKELVRERKTFEFHFIGPIPKKKRILPPQTSDHGPRTTEERNKGPRIVYHGELNDQEEIRMRLQEMDVMVVPSHAEGMPNAILEGMASGNTVISSDVGAVRDMVKKGVGWTIAPGERKALKDRMKEVMDMPRDELRKCREKALDHVRKHFVWETVGEKTLEKIKKAIA